MNFICKFSYFLIFHRKTVQEVGDSMNFICKFSYFLIFHRKTVQEVGDHFPLVLKIEFDSFDFFIFCS